MIVKLDASYDPIYYICGQKEGHWSLEMSTQEIWEYGELLKKLDEWQELIDKRLKNK